MAAEKLNETIAQVNYDNLVYSADVPLITSGAIIASGQGVLKRGTALAKNADNKMVILGSTITKGEGESVTQEVLPADCILSDDVDATDADTSAVVYLKGHFNTDALIVKPDYTITETDRDIFRTKGILVGTAIG